MTTIKINDCKIKESKGYQVFTICNYVIMAFVIFVCLFPYINVVATAFNDGQDTLKGAVGLWPRVFTWANMEAILTMSDTANAFIVSIARVVFGTALAIFLQFTASFVLARKFVGRKFFTYFFLIPAYFSAGLIPTYIWFSSSFLGINNTFWVYILPGAFSFYNMVIMRTYILSSIPQSLFEAAAIDSANHIQVLIKIVVPLSAPILAAITLFTAVTYWNDWTTTLLYASELKSLYTLQYQMMLLIKETDVMISNMANSSANFDVSALSSEGAIAAQVVITTLPILIIYPFFQKYFTTGMMLGGVKE